MTMMKFRYGQGDSPMDVQRDNPLPVEVITHATPNYRYFNTATQATFNVKIGAGFLHSIVINTPLANGTITIYDALSAIANQKIGTVTFPAALLNGPTVLTYNIRFGVGLTVVVGSANLDLTYVYL